MIDLLIKDIGSFDPSLIKSFKRPNGTIPRGEQIITPNVPDGLPLPFHKSKSRLRLLNIMNAGVIPDTAERSAIRNYDSARKLMKRYERLGMATAAERLCGMLVRASARRARLSNAGSGASIDGSPLFATAHSNLCNAYLHYHATGKDVIGPYDLYSDILGFDRFTVVDELHISEPWVVNIYKVLEFESEIDSRINLAWNMLGKLFKDIRRWATLSEDVRDIVVATLFFVSDSINERIILDAAIQIEPALEREFSTLHWEYAVGHNMGDVCVIPGYQADTDSYLDTFRLDENKVWSIENDTERLQWSAHSLAHSIWSNLLTVVDLRSFKDKVSALNDSMRTVDSIVSGILRQDVINCATKTEGFILEIANVITNTAGDGAPLFSLNGNIKHLASLVHEDDLYDIAIQFKDVIQHLSGKCNYVMDLVLKTNVSVDKVKSLATEGAVFNLKVIAEITEILNVDITALSKIAIESRDYVESKLLSAMRTSSAKRTSSGSIPEKKLNHTSQTPESAAVEPTQSDSALLDDIVHLENQLREARSNIFTANVLREEAEQRLERVIAERTDILDSSGRGALERLLIDAATPEDVLRLAEIL